jgi:hypothetical protein
VPSGNIVDGGVNVEENDDDETYNEEDEDDEFHNSENDDDNNSVSSLEEDNFECDESDDEDESLIVMKKPEDSAMKSITILGNTSRCLAKVNKCPNSADSSEDTEHYKELGRILEELAKPVDRYIADRCTVDENGSLRYSCRAMQGTESKEPGVYRAKDNNGRVKTG